MVEEIERLISRGRSAGGTVTPASRGMPPSSGAARGRQMTPVRPSRVLEMDARACGCRPTGCGSLIRGGAIVRVSASRMGSNEEIGGRSSGV